MIGGRAEATLPQSWSSASLGDVLPIAYGKSLPKEARADSGRARVFGSSGEIGSHHDSLTDGPAIIVGRKGNVGSVFYSAGPAWPIDTAYFAEGTASTFLPYFASLLSASNLRSLDRSTAIPGLSRDDYNRIQVAVAPAAEQRRIVSVLDSYMSRLDACDGMLVRSQRSLERFRASTLHAAVEGRLVPTEASLARVAGRSYEPASELLARILIERRRRWTESERRGPYQEPVAPDSSALPELPQGWCWTTVDQLVVELDQGWSPRCERRPADGGCWGVIKTTAIQSLRFDGGENKALPDDLIARPHLEIRSGDLLMTRAGPRSRVGVACYVTQTRGMVMLCDKAYRLRVSAGGFDPRLLAIILSARPSQAAIDRAKTGISDSGVNLTQEGVLSLPIPMPPAAEQTAIVGAVDAALSRSSTLCGDLVATAARVNRLRASTLALAFSGRLVDQDPSDEPASILLDRIRTERAAATATRPSRSARTPKRGQRNA